MTNLPDMFAALRNGALRWVLAAARAQLPAWADGHLSDDELETLEREAAETEESARELRIAVRAEQQRRRDAR